MGRAFEYRKAAKLKRWGHMARTFTKIGKQIAIAVKAGGPEPENNPTLRAIIANAKRENMPKDNIERAIKNAMGKDQSEYKEVTYEGYGPHGIAIFVDTLTVTPPPAASPTSVSPMRPGRPPGEPASTAIPSPPPSRPSSPPSTAWTGSVIKSREKCEWPG